MIAVNSEKQLITLDGVKKTYQTPDKKTIGLLDASFSLFPGEIVTIIGPSGCGKTTLLKIVANIIEPESGSIKYQSQHISEARKAGLLGYVPQHVSLLPNRTVAQNIGLPLRIKEKYDRQKINLDIESLGLSGFGDHYPHELSGGMKQKVSIARALIHEPKLILMDEPFSSLDEITREQLDCKLLSVFHSLKPTILFVTHNIEEAVFLSTRVLLMSNAPGKIIDSITINLPEYRDAGTRSTSDFFAEVVRVREKIRAYV